MFLGEKERKEKEERKKLMLLPSKYSELLKKVNTEAWHEGLHFDLENQSLNAFIDLKTMNRTGTASFLISRPNNLMKHVEMKINFWVQIFNM